ncbi:putative transcription factor MADS-type1 family [Helianthus annuus]|nr:putative transcription factor MADS-type1 family [Helianthus annuus]KAJ0564537.1 putative transcription factor MADS-type1 family [Helianthus annuus]KAJ0732589.1 putative transcription factor MADS-type1 family [Helianthus annuus]
MMGRAKLKMELIAKEKTRNTTYHKRKQGIIKKANEFSILCDVDTSIIIFPPNSNEPEIWPENPVIKSRKISLLTC